MLFANIFRTNSRRKLSICLSVPRYRRYFQEKHSQPFIIQNCGFSNYFMVMLQYFDFSKRETNVKAVLNSYELLDISTKQINLVLLYYFYFGFQCKIGMHYFFRSYLNSYSGAESFVAGAIRFGLRRRFCCRTFLSSIFC